MNISPLSCELSFEPDAARGAGHGLIRCTCPDPRWSEALVSLKPMCQIILRHPSTGRCLGRNGWQNFDERLEITSTERQDATLTLFLDPAIVDTLENQAVYQLRIFLTNAAEESVEAIGGLAPNRILYSRDPSLLSPLESTKKTEAAPMAPMTSITPVAPQPVAAPIPATAVLPVAPLAPEVPKAAPQPAAPLQFPTPSPAAPRPVFRSLMLGLCLCLLAGGAFWAYMNKDALLARFASEQSAPPTATASAPATDKAQISYLNMARQALSTKMPVAEVLALAKHLMEQANDPNAQDGAFLLLDDAASRGNQEACILLADFYAPNLPPHGSIPKDPGLAKRLYQKALPAQKDAQTKLDALMLWAKNAAADNPEANALLQ